MKVRAAQLKLVFRVLAMALAVGVCAGAPGSTAQAQAGFSWGFWPWLGGSSSSTPTQPVAPKVIPPGTNLWVSRGDREIYCQVEGKAAATQTVLLLNGLDRDLTTWEEFLPEISNDVRIIRIDLWAQGQTLKKNGLQTEIDLSDIVKDTDAVLDKVGIVGQLSVVGHSFGGGLAIAMLKESRYKFNKVFLLAPYVPRLEEEQPMVGGMMKSAREMGEALFGKEAYDKFFDMGTSWFMHMSHSAADVRMHTYQETEAIAQLTISIKKLDVYGILKKLEPPRTYFGTGGPTVYLMSSEYDHLIPPAPHIVLWNSIPEVNRGQYFVLKQASHYIPERDKEANLSGKFIHGVLTGTLQLKPGAVGEADIYSGEIKGKGFTKKLGTN